MSSKNDTTLPENKAQPDDRAFVALSPKNASYAAKFSVGDSIWLKQSPYGDPPMSVTVVSRHEDSTGKWSYKLKDANGDEVNSGNTVAEDKLQNNK